MSDELKPPTEPGEPDEVVDPGNALPAPTTAARKVRGDHCLNLFISYELKQQLQELAERYDRTIADMVRTLLRLGIPVMQGMSQAEEALMREYMQVARRMRRVNSLKNM